MNTNKAQMKAFKDSSLDSIRITYGDAMAEATSEMFDTVSAGVAASQLMTKNPLGMLIGVDIISGMSAQTCRLCEKAYGITHEQGKEALALAQELHSKLVGMLEVSAEA